MTRIRTIIPIVAAVTAVLIGVVPHVASAVADDHAAHFLVDDVMIRQGPYLNALALGQGELDHHVVIHCVTTGDTVDGHSRWWRLTDHTTGVKGYTLSKYVSLDSPVVASDCSQVPE